MKNDYEKVRRVILNPNNTQIHKQPIKNLIGLFAKKWNIILNDVNFSPKEKVNFIMYGAKLYFLFHKTFDNK